MSTEKSAPVVGGEVAFVGFYLRGTSFRELSHDPKKVKPAPPGEQRPVGLSVGVKVNIGEHGGAEVTVIARITPDASVMPYEVHVEASGQFLARPGVAQSSLLAFCQMNAPVILWPYVRAEVHRLSADGRYGPVRLDPVNLSAVLQQGDGWQTGEHPVASAPAVRK